MTTINSGIDRRQFLAAASIFRSAAAAAQWAGKEILRNELMLKAQPFPMTAVRLAAGPFKDAQEVNRKYLHRLPVDRLLHTFRLTAGLPSSAEPLGGWEEPKGELRGHFAGHYLSACAFSYSSTGDETLKTKADGMVFELAKCQAALKDGYLSAYPLEFWDRLREGKRVWAPFYTLHKIMAGLLDIHQHCGNQKALTVVENMAGWVDRWTEPLGQERMQKVLDVEYGGMGEVLSNLWAVTGNARYAEIAGRFDKERFFNPLALHRDELKGLHANTHIPQVTAGARRYELTQEPHYREIASFFWDEVTGSRCYVTGGTSNRELWLTDPGRLSAELRMSPNTAECCKEYNMLKLTRHLFQWSPQPRYFDYYERTLFNHRLGTIHPETGASMYYLGLNPGSWKTFGTELDSFWCCTGSGVEEYSKLNDSIYFRDDEGIYVNLFIASDVEWPEKGLWIRQSTSFPEQPGTVLQVDSTRAARMTLRIRVPWWATRGVNLRLNGRRMEVSASPSSYLVLSRVWRKGDKIEVDLPMRLHCEAMPDDATIVAVLYGPIVLAGEMGRIDPARTKVFGPMGPAFKPAEVSIPGLRGDPAAPDSWLKPVPGRPLTFRTSGQGTEFILTPLYKILDERYTVYWKMQSAA